MTGAPLLSKSLLPSDGRGGGSGPASDAWPGRDRTRFESGATHARYGLRVSGVLRWVRLASDGKGSSARRRQKIANKAADDRLGRGGLAAIEQSSQRLLNRPGLN